MTHAKTAENTDSHPVLATERDALAQLLTGVRRAVQVAEDRLSPELICRIQTVAQRASDRLSLSATHTVVALAGATGSGKSSLFNAESGLEISDVSVRRPTTNRASACVWGPKGAKELLEWLGIEESRQIARESVLDAEEQAKLRGLVLVDLPDYDSTVDDHRIEVDRIVERADMVIWVMDPQKYADPRLHAEYLAPLSGRDALMTIVLNHADTLDAESLEMCRDHLRELLVQDGLPDVRLLTTSATRGDGLDELRARLSDAVSARVVSMQRVHADLEDIHAELRQHTGPSVSEEVARNDLELLHTAVSESVGAPMLASAAESAYRLSARRWVAWPLSQLMRNVTPGVRDSVREALPAASVQSAQYEQAARRLAEKLGEDLPDPWPLRLTTAATSQVHEAVNELDKEISAVRLEVERSPWWWRISGVVQWCLFAAALFFGGWVIGASVSNAVRDTAWKLPTVADVSLPSLVVLISLSVGSLLALMLRPLVAARARAERERVQKTMTEACTRVNREKILAPVRVELRAHEALRDAVSDSSADSAEQY